MRSAMVALCRLRSTRLVKFQIGLAEILEALSGPSVDTSHFVITVLMAVVYPDQTGHSWERMAKAFQLVHSVCLVLDIEGTTRKGNFALAVEIVAADKAGEKGSFAVVESGHKGDHDTACRVE